VSFGRAGGPATCDPAPGLYARRVAICRECPAFLPAGRVVGARCAECGCFLKLKARIRGAKCPVGKW
jgi:hypothetical protein